MGVSEIAPKVSAARDIRRQRRRRLVRRLGLGVGLPTLLAALYYLALAAPQYESVTSFTIRSAEGRDTPGVELLLGAVPGSNATRDAGLVQEYIQSRSMLDLLEEQAQFTAHYQQNGDFLSRLGEDTLEERFDYYRDHVGVQYDVQSALLTLRVRAFTPDKAQELAAAILLASEAKVNDLNERSRQDRIALARREVESAESRLSEARAAIVRFQAEHDEINPLESAAALLGVRSELEAELASARAELSAMRRTLQPSAPEFVAQRRRVQALQIQITNQNQRLSGGEDGLGAAIAAFEPMLVEKEFAQRAYQSALASLELARVDADRQHRYLVTVAAPSLPDDATHPRPLRGIFTVFIFAFALLGVGSLLLASVREHANL